MKKSKLDLILENQKKILELEEKLLKEEKEIEEEEKKEVMTISKVENLDEKIEKELKKELNSTLKKITYKDATKAFIGAFIGLVSHFVFLEAFHLSEKISLMRATLWYIIAFIIVILFLYYTGFKKVRIKLILSFLPLRATMIYIVSILTIVFIYLIFGLLHEYNFLYIYKVVGSSIIPAVIGASTADLIGRE